MSAESSPLHSDVERPLYSRFVVASPVYYGWVVLAAFTLPWTGRALDRFGRRVGGVAIATLFGLACLAMSAVQGLITLFACFFLLRALGQRGLGLVSAHAVNLWFMRRHGQAIGLMGGGIALTTAFGPPLVAFGESALGSYTGALWLLAAIPVILSLLALRTTPEHSAGR